MHKMIVYFDPVDKILYNDENIESSRQWKTKSEIRTSESRKDRESEKSGNQKSRKSGRGREGKGRQQDYFSYRCQFRLSVLVCGQASAAEIREKEPMRRSTCPSCSTCVTRWRAACSATGSTEKRFS